MKNKGKILQVIIFVFISMLVFPGGNFSKIEGQNTGKTQELSAQADKIISQWPEKSCAKHITRQSGYPLVSIACKVGYSAKDRKQFLDLIFREGYTLKNENYRLQPKEGFYLYKTEYPPASGRLVFFKLYFY